MPVRYHSGMVRVGLPGLYWHPARNGLAMQEAEVGMAGAGKMAPSIRMPPMREATTGRSNTR
jgi:hypothetical protein